MKRSRAANGGFTGLRAAAPYVRLFRGRVFVLKLGGEVLEGSGSLTALMEQVGGPARPRKSVWCWCTAAGRSRPPWRGGWATSRASWRAGA